MVGFQGFNSLTFGAPREGVQNCSLSGEVCIMRVAKFPDRFRGHSCKDKLPTASEPNPIVKIIGMVGGVWMRVPVVSPCPLKVRHERVMIWDRAFVDPTAQEPVS